MIRYRSGHRNAVPDNTERAIIRAMQWVLIALSVGCGRVDFDPEVPGRDALTDAVPDAQPGLLLHYTFDSTRFQLDLAPAHHDATCTMCPQPVPGRVGDGAAHFDGASCLVVPDGQDLHPAAFTVAYWISGETPNQATDVFARPFDGQTGNADVFELAYDSSSSVTIDGANNTFMIQAITAGWHHVGYVFDGSAQSLYVDGALVKNPQVVGSVTYHDDKDLIGCDVNAGVEVTFFLGSVDDLRLYDHALDADSVAALAAM